MSSRHIDLTTTSFRHSVPTGYCRSETCGSPIFMFIFSSCSTNVCHRLLIFTEHGAATSLLPSVNRHYSISLLLFQQAFHMKHIQRWPPAHVSRYRSSLNVNSLNYIEHCYFISFIVLLNKIQKWYVRSTKIFYLTLRLSLF